MFEGKAWPRLLKLPCRWRSNLPISVHSAIFPIPSCQAILSEKCTRKRKGCMDGSVWSRALLCFLGALHSRNAGFWVGCAGLLRLCHLSANILGSLSRCLESRVTHTKHVECINWRRISLALELFSHALSLAAKPAGCSME